MHIVSQVIILLLCTLLASAAAIIAMLVSLSRQGDERRRMIVEKASARSFLSPCSCSRRWLSDMLRWSFSASSPPFTR